MNRQNVNPNQGKFVFLGTGASTGVPVISCNCRVCTSSNPKDKRLRPSVALHLQGKTYLIDAGPDIRQQALKHELKQVDGLILTHTHFDHVGGLEELRIFNFIQGRSIPCLLSTESYNDIRKLFYYLFSEKNGAQNHTSQFDFVPLTEKTGIINFEGLELDYFCYFQGDMKVLGLRFGDLAYLTDMNAYTDDIFDFLKGVSTLIVSALRFTPSRLHFTIDAAIDFVKKAQVPNSYFMHLSHDIEYDAVATLLPPGIHLAYDGLELSFTMRSKK